MAQKKATTRKKKPAKLKFELSKSSVAGITVVCFCLFLWMFLIGVWTGQSILSPYPAVPSLTKKAGGPPPFIKAVEKKRVVMKKGNSS